MRESSVSIVRGEVAGFAAYLTKPLQVNEFVHAVHAVLKTRDR
jgi:DNA-binding response OmpR family regulator